MMKRFALMLMLLIPLMAGCLTDSGDDDKDSSTEYSATTYTPLKNGATYEYTEIEYYNGEADSTEYTSAISGPVSKNGILYYLMIDTYDDFPNWPDTTYVRISGNTLYKLNTFWLVMAKTAQKIGHIVPKFADDIGTDVEIPFMNFDATTWAIYDDTLIHQFYTMDVSWNGKYLGTEDVTVPAGTFKKCPTFEITKNQEITYTYDDEDDNIVTRETTLTMWWAANIGWVKSTSEVNVLNDYTEVMATEYTSTTVLNSYNIP